MVGTVVFWVFIALGKFDGAVDGLEVRFERMLLGMIVGSLLGFIVGGIVGTLDGKADFVGTTLGYDEAAKVGLVLSLGKFVGLADPVGRRDGVGVGALDGYCISKCSYTFTTPTPFPDGPLIARPSPSADRLTGRRKRSVDISPVYTSPAFTHVSFDNL